MLLRQRQPIAQQCERCCRIWLVACCTVTLLESCNPFERRTNLQFNPPTLHLVASSLSTSHEAGMHLPSNKVNKL